MLKKQTDILLESGTNELEILEFVLGTDSFGINVAKVRELLRYQPIQKVPHAQPHVEGVFRSRNDIITVVDLVGYLGFPPSEQVEQDILMVTSFNQMHIAFHLHKVEGIQRISWEKIEKPNEAIYGGSDGIVTGIAKLSDKMISILDFEKIVYDINPNFSIQAKAEEISKERAGLRNTRPILIAEDSMLLRKMLLEALHMAGYANLTIKENGQEAWEYLELLKKMEKPITEQVACIITDIEMPKMDGHHLTKRIKSDKVLAQIPVIIFSSLISEDLRHKGEAVGADAQLSKPEIHQLVQKLDELVV